MGGLSIWHWIIVIAIIAAFIASVRFLLHLFGGRAWRTIGAIFTLFFMIGLFAESGAVARAIGYGLGPAILAAIVCAIQSWRAPKGAA